MTCDPVVASPSRGGVQGTLFRVPGPPFWSVWGAEAGLYGYYGWDPYWGGGFYGMGAIAAPFSSRPYFGGLGMGEAAEIHSLSWQGSN